VLSNETMGAFCLGVVWLNGLLIAAHVWQTQRALTRERSAIGSVVRGVVVDTGDAAALAVVHLTQIGRAITEDGPSRILLTEAKRRCDVHDATVEVGDAKLAVIASEVVRVWCLNATPAHEGDFERAFGEASTSRGYQTEVDLAIGTKGGTVWIGGERDGDTLRARLVSDRDPAAVLASARGRAATFVVLNLVALVGITALALVRPWCTGLSTLGGMLAVAYFLGVQPIANALRESMAGPAARPIGGIWQRT
jgi:hypothetical protein